METIYIVKPGATILARPDRYFQNKRAHLAVCPRCGDGGNRTRVRKIRPLNLYKFSRPI